jgi:DHA2 family multidrug resistance protein
VFVPLNTIAFATLPGELRTDGTAIWTLIRNPGSSIGISLIISELTNLIDVFHSQLAEKITPFNDALQMPDIAAVLSTRTDAGRALLDQMVTRQAAVMAYSNNFLIMTFISLCAFPLLIRAPKAAPSGPGPAGAAAAAMD